MTKIKPKDKPHYVNNREFSQAVMDYVIESNKAEKNGDSRPVVPEYIARCFLRIANGLSHRPNFSRYTYRDEMVMDAVENSLKAIMNYDIEAATRSGKPNAFSYFTQISYFAFLRRIAKEKKQQEIKEKYISRASPTEFMHLSSEDLLYLDDQDLAFVDVLKNRINDIKTNDQVIQDFIKEERKMERQGLEDFYEE